MLKTCTHTLTHILYTYTYIHTTTTQLLQQVKAELSKPPENRAWQTAARFRRAYHYLNKMPVESSSKKHKGGRVSAGATAMKSTVREPVKPNLRELMTTFFISQQRRAQAYTRATELLTVLKQQIQHTKEFNRLVRDEVTESRRYLKKTFEGFSISQLHGGSSFVKRALKASGADKKQVSQAAKSMAKNAKAVARAEKAMGDEAIAAAGAAAASKTDSSDPMFLIQQLTSGGEGSITATRVALAKDGRLKATFQSKTMAKLRDMGVVARFIRKTPLKLPVQGAKKKKMMKMTNSDLGEDITYLFAGSELDQDLFSVSMSITGRHMVESFSLSVRCLAHMQRSMVMTFQPEGSETVFYVEPLLEMLKSMHQAERVLNFGSR